MLTRLKAGLDYFAGILVLLNSLVLLIQFEMEGRIVGLSVGLSDGPAWEEVIPALQIVDIVFVFIFLVEWLIRIAVERWAFLKDYANLFDTMLVMSGLVDMYINLAFVGDTTASKSIVILRLMRAMKSFRAIRMVRSLRFFRGLRVLVKACQCFLPSLCWSMVLLMIFMAMGALMLGNLLQSFVDDDEQNIDDRQWIWTHYGTAYRALYTLFEITFAGNWPTNTRPVLEKVSHGFAIFFICYITLVVFAIIRVISAVFLKDTLDAAQNDAEALVVDKIHKKAEFVVKLEGIFNAIDDTGSGIISEERLTTILANPKVAAYFQTMDIDIHEGKALFHVLNHGEDGVSLDEFIDGILKCKGPARAIDQVAMHAELKQLDYKLTRHWEF
ncbi:Scn11a [Symbiodinium natans]|uniref:Scn11a protein n=1 Tax=Symbiodinium natans TaxID=878477 RepID=A0A812MN08_9DINO|nr:Scn11a [Symbiodinium natans]